MRRLKEEIYKECDEIMEDVKRRSEKLDRDIARSLQAAQTR